MKRIILPLLALCSCSPIGLWAQSPLAPNTQHYLATMQRATRGGIVPQIEAYVAVDEARFVPEAIAKLGGTIQLNLGDLLTIQLPSDQLATLAQTAGVTYVQLAATPQLQLDEARAEAGIDRIHAAEALPHAFTGKGTVVGIIDAGFDYTHPNFYTADGKTLRIRRIWEQGNTTGQHPEKFTYGAEYATPEAIIQASYDIPGNSHGTHVAGIAAGNYHGNNWYGVAGDADLVLVSKGDLTPNNVNISDAIAYIYQYAESVGKPCVINMSLGMEIGPHDGTSLFDQVSDRLQGPGKILVGSVGNFRGAPIHVSKTFSGSGDSPLRTMADYKIKPSAKKVGGEIDIWGEKGMQYDVQVVVYNYKGDKIECASEILDVSKAEGQTSIFEITRNGAGRVLITTEINPFNHKPHAYLSLEVENIRTRNAIGIILTPKTAGTVHAWADNTYVTLTDNEAAGWTAGNGDFTLAEIGGTGKRIISVGAYTTRNSFTRLGSTDVENLDETMGDIASFSSAGPALDGRMKPEITTPGTYLISSVNSHDGTLGSVTPLAGGIEGTNYCYGYMQGTSMAAPFMAGTIATWLEADPTLSPERLREVLRTTAKNDKMTATVGKSHLWGWGKLDAYKGLKNILSTTGIENGYRSDNWVSFHQDHLLLHQNCSKIRIQLYNAEGKCCSQRYYENVRAGEEIQLSTAAMTHGVYFLKVGHSRGTKTFKWVK